ncbi:class B sortase [Alkalihalobacillus oceani]|uniref:Class B sortase n=1 Tax=Halalkalibacter oceani TaxID=1653776 RepID=A0A9X2IPY7_9BACI|nr:class B sortase [Halalkalibacter oceani]MCM3714053.1 class B sortase [Halalkalibacter oceani]
MKKLAGIYQRIGISLCVTVSGFSLFHVTDVYVEGKQNEVTLEEARQLYEPAPVLPAAAQSEQKQVEEPRFEKLRRLNEDIIGWIQIDGTPVDYPLLQAADNETYLSLDYKGEKQRAGSIFVDYRNAAPLQERHTIIYGHHMRDGSMFAGLQKFVEPDFLKRHKMFTIETLTDSYQIEIFAVYRTTTDFYYLETDFHSDEAFLSFIEEIQARSLHQAEVDITADDKIVTLSTCDYVADPADGRLVIHGKVRAD